MGQEQSVPSEGSEDVSSIRGPARANVTVLGLVHDEELQRDSITSVRVGDRQFWTSRDATCFNGKPFFFFTSTASWTDFGPDGKPQIVNGALKTYGKNTTTYFDSGPNRHPPHGSSGNGQERWLIWPDSPPLPVRDPSGTTKLYTWIKNAYQSHEGHVNPEALPSTSLYRSDHLGSSSPKNALPPVKLLNTAFWPSNSISFGSYGWLITTDKQAYLYGQGVHGCTLARVSLDRIEDTGAYTFYNAASSSWDSSPPAPSDTSAVIPNAGTGQQGTFYHSRYFDRYVWIGGRAPCCSDFQVTTAPQPWGPWEPPRTFYVAPPGEKFAGYSWQAHPGLSEREGHGRDIFLTFTRINEYFENVLIRVEWF